jgi:hypothetical protein
MLGIRFIKAPPTTFLMHFKNGAVKREGPGLSFFYYAPSSSLVGVPLGSRDVPFTFQESTQDFQPITVGGQLTFRVTEPRKLAAALDHSLDASGRHLSDAPELLPQRLVQHVQVLMKARLSALPLRRALAEAETMGREVLAGMRVLGSIGELGVEVMDLAILSAKPSPEMGRALEAEARESLQRQADEAIYARRRAAVEQERRIKETEMQTELSVEEKKRLIRETQVAADISVEEQRKVLAGARAENTRVDADAQAYAMRATLEPLRTADWRMMMALAARNGDPRVSIAMAFRELAENAQKIGELNVTPDLLNSLLAPKK